MTGEEQEFKVVGVGQNEAIELVGRVVLVHNDT